MCQPQIGHKILKNLLHNLLYLEHEVLILVSRVPQSVQKVKSINSHKGLGVLAQTFE